MKSNKIKYHVIIATMLILLLMTACMMSQPSSTAAPAGTPSTPKPTSTITPAPSVTPTTPVKTIGKTVVMKGVGIAIPQKDFLSMRAAGIEVLTTEWGMEESFSEVRTFLDRAHAAGLKVILDGGFSYKAWGFTDSDWDNLPKGKKPVWQKERVQNWVKTFKDHPAVSGWDICNEYGENLPSGSGADNSDWPKTATTLDQLKQARADVLQIDPGKPIMIRTYSWEYEEPPFGYHRPFEAGLAEIVSLNLYSNYLDNGKLEWPTVIEDSASRYTEIIKKVDPKIKIWIALGAFEDLPLFQKPTVARLTKDIDVSLKISGIDGISFFCWGPSYPSAANGKSWSLPESGTDLWDVIKRSIK